MPRPIWKYDRPPHKGGAPCHSPARRSLPPLPPSCCSSSRRPGLAAYATIVIGARRDVGVGGNAAGRFRDVGSVERGDAGISQASCGRIDAGHRARRFGEFGFRPGSSLAGRSADRRGALARGCPRRAELRRLACRPQQAKRHGRAARPRQGCRGDQNRRRRQFRDDTAGAEAGGLRAKPARRAGRVRASPGRASSCRCRRRRRSAAPRCGIGVDATGRRL